MNRRNKVLMIDLTNRKFNVEERPELFAQYIGGSGVSIKLLEEESWRQVLSSLVVCFFARGIFDPETVTKLLEVAGHELSVEDLNEFGRKVHRLKYEFKEREGFTHEGLRIPNRIYEIPSARGIVEEKIIRSSIKSFFEKLKAS